MSDWTLILRKKGICQAQLSCEFNEFNTDIRQIRKCVRYYTQVACVILGPALVYCNFHRDVMLGSGRHVSACATILRLRALGQLRGRRLDFMPVRQSLCATILLGSCSMHCTGTLRLSGGQIMHVSGFRSQILDRRKIPVVSVCITPKVNFQL